MAWYAWLNIAGLIILWGGYVINHKIEETGFFGRWFNHLTLLSAGFFVVAHGSGSLSSAPTLATGLLALFVTGAIGWELLASVYHLWFRTPETTTAEAIAQPIGGPAASMREDGVVDLDAGTAHSRENQERIGRAIGDVFNPNASASERLQGVGVLLGAGAHEANEGDDNDNEDSPIINLVSFGLVFAVLGLPLYVALGLLV